jgi:DNA-binding response OmpR family regulator
VKLVLAEGGEAGLRIARQRSVQMVVLDAFLPDADSEALIGALRRNAAIASAPIIVLTDDGAPSERARFVGAGANAFLAKPLDVAEIDQTVAMLLEVASWRLSAPGAPPAT